MSAVGLTFGTEAYLKMLLHCCQYPTSTVCGLLLAPATKDGSASTEDRITCVDVLPLLHSSPLGPLLNISFQMAEHLASQRQQKIAGLYMASETLEDNEISTVATRIGSQMVATQSDSVVFMVDNMKLRRGDEIAGSLYVHKSGKWQRSSAPLMMEDGHALEIPKKLFTQRVRPHIVDFEEHTDRPEADWTNAELSATLLSSNKKKQ